MNDKASYVLIASNKLGTTTSNALQLQVIMVPLVSLTGPSHVLVGTTALLKATIKSTETTTDTWLRVYNGISYVIIIDNIKYVRRFVITGDNEMENILEIRNVGYQDMVFYQLQVSNSAGQSFSNKIHLNPMKAPPFLADSALVMKNVAMETTIEINLNATFFTNDMNGPIVYFGIAVCSNCSGLDKQSRTARYMWESLPNWFEARMHQFTLYRATNDYFMTAIKLHANTLKTDSKVAVITGSTTGALAFVILTIAVILVYRKCSASGYTQLRRNYNFKPIQVECLLNHVHELTKENCARLSNEFSELNSLVTKDTATVGKLMQNFEKNRSSTITYDFNRVKLDSPLDLPEMNYINASHVFNNEYIITQYPQRRTMADFWKMIWEQDVPAIIMLAPLNEMEMCFRYYRRKQGASCKFGDVVITLMATFMFGKNLKVRKLNVRRKRNRKISRIITHFHVYALDESTIAKDFVGCIKIIRSNIQLGAQPLVVHSGSGQEWSGVFVMLDYVIQKIRNGSNTVDISAATLQLLDERMAVLSKNQYALLYLCLEIYLKQSSINHVSNSSDGEGYETRITGDFRGGNRCLGGVSPVDQSSRRESYVLVREYL
ncbi:receptor-type tyrosine-protein phosphatase beta-like [Saccostrea echinata]|uniref:receptor-type tyrosine-protein phosphatase beta-like n=1 Tax=Saccostrea echinata TaxID=191078 RepID=UPI002A805B0B|nr:receptor-type tyrosine-protein phosphatase beta-like [Saccostrea echinata]